MRCTSWPLHTLTWSASYKPWSTAAGLCVCVCALCVNSMFWWRAYVLKQQPFVISATCDCCMHAGQLRHSRKGGFGHLPQSAFCLHRALASLPTNEPAWPATKALRRDITLLQGEICMLHGDAARAQVTCGTPCDICRLMASPPGEG